jgi:hypothetical protein
MSTLFMAETVRNIAAYGSFALVLSDDRGNECSDRRVVVNGARSAVFTALSACTANAVRARTLIYGEPLFTLGIDLLSLSPGDNVPFDLDWTTTGELPVSPNAQRTYQILWDASALLAGGSGVALDHFDDVVRVLTLVSGFGADIGPIFYGAFSAQDVEGDLDVDLLSLINACSSALVLECDLTVTIAPMLRSYLR